MRLRFLVVFLLLAGTGYSQTFSGTIDGYWSYNNNEPRVPGNEQINDFRSFDMRDQQFAFQYGELAVEYKPGKFGFRADIGIGDTANAVHAGEPAGQDLWRHVQQAYITGSAGSWTVDFGKFVTPIGAEVIETTDNWNYSRGLLFSWAIPFYHFGARTSISVNEKVGLTAYLVNGWDNVKDLNTAKSVGFSGTFKPGNMTITTNYLVGKENPETDDARQLFDGVFVWDILPQVALMGNYDYGWDKATSLVPGVSGPGVVWQGAAGYARLGDPDKFSIVPRYEWFQDRQGFRTGTAQNLESFTLTGQIPVEDAKFWVEYRRDWSTASTFNKSTDSIGGPINEATDNQNTFAIGFTYAFTKGMN